MVNEARVAKLEGQLARIKVTNYVLAQSACALVVVLLLGAMQTEGTTKENRSRKFVVEDRNGKVRVVIGTDEDSDDASFPFVRLFNESGKICAVYSSEVINVGTTGDKSATLGVNEDGPWLDLRANDASVLVSVDREGGSLRMRDQARKTQVVLGQRRLGLSDENGNLRCAIGRCETVTQDGKRVSYPESSVVLFGPDNRVVWQAP